jgi:hypothetical protein
MRQFQGTAQALLAWAVLGSEKFTLPMGKETQVFRSAFRSASTSSFTRTGLLT